MNLKHAFTSLFSGKRSESKMFYIGLAATILCKNSQAACDILNGLSNAFLGADIHTFLGGGSGGYVLGRFLNKAGTPPANSEP